MTELDRPIRESYWVESGRFLVGEYPVVPNERRTHERLNLLLESGINTYYDLTFLDKSHTYLSILREEARRHEVRIQHIRFPIMDHNTPPRGMMIAILDAIDNALAKGRNVYLYCWDGIGYCGTTVGCYLVRHGNTGEQALKQLADWWKGVPKSDYFPRSPETSQQKAYVLNWWENLPTTPPSPEPPTRPVPKGGWTSTNQYSPFAQQASWPRKLFKRLFQRTERIQLSSEPTKDAPTQPMTELDHPIRESYWVEPGRFLAGEYPSAPYIWRARERLGGLLKVGVNTFIDLTIPNELPPYLPILHEQAKLHDVEVQYKRLPILDRSTPLRAAMIEILDTLDGALDEGRNIYLHCWGGIGRTGTTVGCYLVRRGLTGREALAQLADWWKDVPKSAYTPRSPETDQQVEFVLKWKENSTSSESQSFP